MTTKTDTARQQAEAQLEKIRQLMDWLDHANECDSDFTGSRDDCNWQNDYVKSYFGKAFISEDAHNIDAATQAIHENALDVEVNYGWHAPGGMYPTTGEFPTPERFRILLCTGGPAVRITGELNGYGEPETARLEYQDWGTPWTVYTDYDYDLLSFADQFYFGS